MARVVINSAIQVADNLKALQWTYFGQQLLPPLEVGVRPPSLCVRHRELEPARSGCVRPPAPALGDRAQGDADRYRWWLYRQLSGRPLSALATASRTEPGTCCRRCRCWISTITTIMLQPESLEPGGQESGFAAGTTASFLPCQPTLSLLLAATSSLQRSQSQSVHFLYSRDKGPSRMASNLQDCRLSANHLEARQAVH
mgnify:CR=1 FL=1